MNNPMYSNEEVSTIFNRSYKTIWKWWAKDKTFPKPVQRNGRSLGFLKTDIDSYIHKLAEQNH